MEDAIQQAEEQPEPRLVGGIDDQVAYIFSRTADPSSKSNYRAMTDQMPRVKHVSMTCPKCEGRGYRSLSRADLERWEKRIERENPESRPAIRRKLAEASNCYLCKGIGCIEGEPTGRIDMFFTTAWCGKCRGCGEILNEDLEDVCQRCDGDKCIVPVTCKPTGVEYYAMHGGASSVDAGDESSCSSGRAWSKDDEELYPGERTDAWIARPSEAADEDELCELGRISRILESVTAIDELAARAIKEYYGAAGDKYGPTKWGRLFAIWPFTSGGKELVQIANQRSKSGHGFLLKPLEVLASERIAQEIKNDFRRSSCIRRADNEARTLRTRGHKIIRQVAGL